MTRADRQNGVALITAILVVAAASALAATFTTHQQLNIRRTGNLINGDQAWTYDEGAETWIKQILSRDLEENQIDHLGERWAQPLPPLEVPGGYISGRITDMQGRFNINNLISEQGQVQADVLQRFQRLLNLLEIDPDLAQAVVDWLDPNVEALPPNGAEDDYYVGLKPAYLAANRKMASASELRMVKGFDAEAYARIAPFVCALPEQTGINVNTAPAEVLAALAPDASVEGMAGVIERRTEKPFESVQELRQAPGLQGVQLNAGNLTVSSRYFRLTTDTQVATGRASVNSLILRKDPKNVYVLRRGQASGVSASVRTLQSEPSDSDSSEEDDEDDASGEDRTG